MNEINILNCSTELTHIDLAVILYCIIYNLSIIYFIAREQVTNNKD